MPDGTVNSGATIASDAAIILPTVLDDVEKVSAIEQDAANVGGQHGTDLTSRVTALEGLLTDVTTAYQETKNMLAFLFPAHFKL